MSRKRPGGQPEYLNSSIERDMAKFTDAIRDGTYPPLARANDCLLAAKYRRQNMADKRRKLQIKNINDLYDYELRDIQSQYVDAYSTAQTRFRRELAEEAHRLEELRKQAAVGSVGAKSEEELVESEANKSAVDASVGSTRSQQLTHEQHLAGQALPSTAACSRNGSNIGGKFRDAGIGGSVGAGVGTSRRSRSGQGQGSSATPLVFALPDSTMRADFRCIVDDLQARAAYFARTAPLPNPAVKIVDSSGGGNGEMFHLCVGATVFVAGDLVMAFSVLSQETFSGVITSVAADEVSVRCGSGLRIAVVLKQLIEGRVVLSHDQEGNHMLGIMQAHSMMARGEEAQTHL